MTRRALILFAGLLGVIGIAARAFEAHGLIGLADISEPRIRDFSSGTELILFNALASLALAGVAAYLRRFTLWCAVAFVSGVLLFAGPLLTYGLTGSRTLIMLTPIGGVLMISGWLLLVIGAVVARGPDSSTE